MRRKRKILWKDFPGDAARRWVQRSRGMDGDVGRAGHQRGTTEKTRTRHPLEQHTQLGLRLQPRVTHSRSSLPPGPPALTVQEPMEAADTLCLWRAREDLSGNALVFLLPNLEKFFEKSLMGEKENNPH